MADPELANPEEMTPEEAMGALVEYMRESPFWTKEAKDLAVMAAKPGVVPMDRVAFPMVVAKTDWDRPSATSSVPIYKAAKIMRARLNKQNINHAIDVGVLDGILERSRFTVKASSMMNDTVKRQVFKSDQPLGEPFVIPMGDAVLAPIPIIEHDNMATVIASAILKGESVTFERMDGGQVMVEMWRWEKGRRTTTGRRFVSRTTSVDVDSHELSGAIMKLAVEVGLDDALPTSAE